MPAGVTAKTTRARLTYAMEATPGTRPAANLFRRARFTRATLGQTPTYEPSEEIEDDRMPNDEILVTSPVGGEVGIELSHGTHDDWFEALMYGTWNRTPTLSGAQITSVATGGVFNVSSGGTNFKLGHLVRSTGQRLSANNAIQRITDASTATSITMGIVTTADVTPGLTGRLKVIGFAGSTGQISATATGIASGTLNFTTLGLYDGMYLYVDGNDTTRRFASPANRGLVRIAPGGITSGNVNFDIRPAGWGVDAGTGRDIWVYMPDRLVNGATRRAISFERSFMDIDSHETFSGCHIGTYRQEMPNRKPVKGTFTYMGMRGTEPGAIYAASPLARNEAPIYSTSAANGYVAENGTNVGDPNFAEGASLEVNNNLREQPGLFIPGAIGAGEGAFEAYLNLSAYLGEHALLQKVIRGTETGIALGTPDAVGNMELWSLPRAKIVQGTAPVEGRNRDVVVPYRFKALRHVAFGHMLALYSFEGILQAS